MRRLMACICTGALAIAIAPALAGAQSSPAQPAAIVGPAGDCAKAKRAGRACQITFEQGESIDGERPTAGSDTVTGRTGLVFSNLISVRSSFRPEIIAAAEDL